MRTLFGRRPLLLLIAATAVLFLTGAGGGAVGRYLSDVSRYLALRATYFLVQNGVIRQTTVVSFWVWCVGAWVGLMTLGFALLLAGDGESREFRGRRGRRLAAASVAAVGGLGCAWLVIGGAAPERSHWLGTGLIGAAAVGCAVGTLYVSCTASRVGALRRGGRARWRHLSGTRAGLWVKALGLGLASATLAACAGWWFSVPPTDETVASDRLEHRGTYVGWERVGDASHAVEVKFLDDDDPALRRGDVDSFVADLRRLPHLRVVGCAPRSSESPALRDYSNTVFERIEAGLPGVKVTKPAGRVPVTMPRVHLPPLRFPAAEPRPGP